VCTHPLSEKYAIFDIAESRFFSQNAPKSFVAGLRSDPLGEQRLHCSPRPLAAFDGQDYFQERGGEMVRTPYGNFLATPLQASTISKLQQLARGKTAATETTIRSATFSAFMQISTVSALL